MRNSISSLSFFLFSLFFSFLSFIFIFHIELIYTHNSHPEQSNIVMHVRESKVRVREYPVYQFHLNGTPAWKVHVSGSGDRVESTWTFGYPIATGYRSIRTISSDQFPIRFVFLHVPFSFFSVNFFFRFSLFPKFRFLNAHIRTFVQNDDNINFVGSSRAATDSLFPKWRES